MKQEGGQYDLKIIYLDKNFMSKIHNLDGMDKFLNNQKLLKHLRRERKFEFINIKHSPINFNLKWP
jgi:hypothetical protein